MFKKLVNRGNAVIYEWHNYEGMNDNSSLMIAEVAASTLSKVCGETMKDWSPEEQKDRANIIKIALTTAFQIGREEATSKTIKQTKRKNSA